MTPDQAKMVKLMAATLQADLKLARGLQRPGSPVFKGLVLQLGCLIQDVNAAKLLKDQADAIRNFLSEIQRGQEITAETPGWVVPMMLNQHVCLDKLNRLVTSASATSATDAAPLLQDLEKNAQK